MTSSSICAKARTLFCDGSGPNFLKQNGLMMYVPQGFAHGYQALTDGATSVLLGKCLLRAGRPRVAYASTTQSSQLRGRARFPTLSDKDARWPLLRR